MEIRYFVAGIDVHKSMLAVVIADVGREGGVWLRAAPVRHHPWRVETVESLAN